MSKNLQLSPELDKAWKRFASGANWQLLHPLDVDRFYQFVWLAYQEGHIISDLPFHQFIEANAPTYARDELIIRLEQARDLLDVVNGRGTRG